MTTDSKTGGFWNSGWKRGLVMLALVAVGGVVPGCFVETSSGPPAVCNDSNITFDWVITANGITRSCAQVGGDSVSIMIDNTSMIADFPCTAFAGTTLPVVGGVPHTVTIALFDSANNILSQLDPVTVTTRCGGVTDLGQVEFSLTP